MQLHATAFAVPDTVPPVISLPSTINTKSATAAAIVIYTATATDNVDPAPVVTCTPASGQAFPTDQATTVTCTATDAAGNTATGSFRVAVAGKRPLHKALFTCMRGSPA
jgi:hypothetical protein